MPCPTLCMIYPSHYIMTLQFSLSIVTQLFFTIHAPYALAMGLKVWGLNPGGGEIFRTCPDRAWCPPSLLYNGYWDFPRGKEWPGRDTDPSPPSSAMVKKEYSYTSTPPMGCMACTEPQCLYKGVLFLYLYLSSAEVKDDVELYL